MGTNTDTIYTPKQLAIECGVSVSAVYMWINDGLKCERTRGTSGAITIKKSDFERWRKEDA